MRNDALYFPYIEVPDEVWTTRILLYWDRLSSIVPMDYVEEPALLSPYMRDLVREGLVHQVVPARYLHRFPNFEDNFVRYVEHRLSRMRPQGIKSKRTRIHIEKLGNLPHWLEERGLAECDRYPWYQVEQWVASAFMAYLATSLGGLDDIHAAPITNDISTSRLFGAFRANKSVEREFLLEKLLPAPRVQPSLSSLIKFKERYGALLPPFREHVELVSAELGAIRDTQQRLARAEVIAKELHDQVREIEDAMKASWKAVVFGSFVPLLGVGGAFYAADPSRLTIAAGAAGLSFVGTAYQTISGVREKSKSQRRKPLAYLAYARRNLIGMA